MSEPIEARITETLVIPGRGTVLIAELQNAQQIAAGDMLVLSGRRIPIRAIERLPTVPYEAGLVMGNGVKPADINYPLNVIIEKGEDATNA